MASTARAPARLLPAALEGSAQRGAVRLVGRDLGRGGGEAARPVVASEVGGIPEIHRGESAGALVPARDSTALARGIDMTVRREWDPERLRTIVSHMTWPWNARQVLAAMALALRQPESPRPRGSSDEAVADRVSLPSGR